MISDVFCASAMILASRARAGSLAFGGSWAQTGPATNARQTAANTAAREYKRDMVPFKWVDVRSDEWSGELCRRGGEKATGKVLTESSSGPRPGRSGRNRDPGAARGYTERMHVLFEDHHLIAVNKPAPLMTQAPADVPSLEADVKAYIKDKYGKPAGVYLGIPH